MKNLNISAQDNNKKRIILTGGGTAGHVIPQIALLPYLNKKKWDVLYVTAVLQPSYFLYLHYLALKNYES